MMGHGRGPGAPIEWLFDRDIHHNNNSTHNVTSASMTATFTLKLVTVSSTAATLYITVGSALEA